MNSPRFGRFGPPVEEATPVGIHVAEGAVAIALATFLATLIPVADSDSAQAVVAATVGVFAACTLAPTALALLLAPSWMIMNGFLINRSGDLTWHGASDVYRFVLLAGAGAVGLLFGALARQIHELRERLRLGIAVEAMSTEFTSREFTSPEFQSTEFTSRKFDEEKHRA